MVSASVKFHDILALSLTNEQRLSISGEYGASGFLKMMKYYVVYVVVYKFGIPADRFLCPSAVCTEWRVQGAGIPSVGVPLRLRGAVYVH